MENNLGTLREDIWKCLYFHMELNVVQALMEFKHMMNFTSIDIAGEVANICKKDFVSDGKFPFEQLGMLPSVAR